MAEGGPGGASHPRDKKMYQYIFLGLSTWESRLTIACFEDILRLWYATKNQLEDCPSMELVQEHLARLRSRLTSYTDKSSSLAAALVGDAALEGGYEAEKVCRLWRSQQGQEVKVHYTAKDDTEHEYYLQFENKP